MPEPLRPETNAPCSWTRLDHISPRHERQPVSTGARIWHSGIGAAFPSRFWFCLQEPCNYWTLSKNDLGLLGLKLTNYVNSIRGRQTCLVPTKLAYSRAGSGANVLNGSHLGDRKHFGFHVCLSSANDLKKIAIIIIYIHAVVAASRGTDWVWITALGS